MAEKPDLIKLFGVEGQVTPRRLYNETAKDISLKTPYNVCGEIHVLVDMLNIAILQQDIEVSMKIIQGLVMRCAFLQEQLIDIKNLIDKVRKGKKDD